MFLVTLLSGIAAVVATATAPLYVDRTPLRRSPLLGTALALAAVGLGLAAAGPVPARPGLALAAFPLLLCGALLLVAPEAGDADGPARDDGEPPWWPEFEDAFRRYSGRPRLPLARR